MCSGRIDPEFILHAFEKGIDGVMVIGCHIGDCHYVSGNLEAEKKVKIVKRLLEIVGFESDRLALEWVSAAEGLRFSRLIADFVEKIRQLGPNPLKKTEEKIELKR
jgi:coenzyme F420-reducing hydrogenase delta subunit